MKRSALFLKSFAISVMLALFIAPACLAATSDPAVQQPAPDMPASSIYCWSPYSFAPESSNGAVFEALNVKRVYQSFGSDYKKVLKSQDTARAIADINDRGMEVLLLCGQPNWGMSESELKKAKDRIDAIRQYNEGIGARAQIKGVVFDIESFTSDAWKELKNQQQEAVAFRTYVDNMKSLYGYAQENGVYVIQCIPRWLENRSEDLLREFIRDCCDEISVMNYNVGGEVKDIKTEVELCQEYGKPIESIFNTMPPNDTTIPESSTYYNKTFAELLSNWDKLEAAYGTDSVGMSYHHFQNIIPLISDGGFIADVYAFTSDDDPTRDANGQTSALGSITLIGNDGSVIYADLYCPSMLVSEPEVAYLAIGVKPGVQYTVMAGDPEHYRVLTKTPRFEFVEGKPLLSATIEIEPGSSVEPNKPDVQEKPTDPGESGNVETPGTGTNPSSPNDGNVTPGSGNAIDDATTPDEGKAPDTGDIIRPDAPAGPQTNMGSSTTQGQTPSQASVKRLANKMIAKPKANTLVVKHAKLKKKNQTIAKAKAFKITKAIGKVTFKKASGNKKITISKAGKITLKKGLKKGTYKIKVKVNAAGNAKYLKVTKTVTLKIKVA